MFIVCKELRSHEWGRSLPTQWSHTCYSSVHFLCSNGPREMPGRDLNIWYESGYSSRVSQPPASHPLAHTLTHIKIDAVSGIVIGPWFWLTNLVWIGVGENTQRLEILMTFFQRKPTFWATWCLETALAICCKFRKGAGRWDWRPHSECCAQIWGHLEYEQGAS